jgi:hypothetical protein
MAKAAEGYAAQMEGVERLRLPELRTAWGDRWGDVPAFRSRDLLSRAFLYRLQAEANGDLEARLKRELRLHALRFEKDRGHDPGPAVNLKPGTVLVREWAGKRHEVQVIAKGFQYGGETYRSLSKVAETITGTRWNGLLFFGLRSRPQKGSSAATEGGGA